MGSDLKSYLELGARCWFEGLGPMGCLKCGRSGQMRLHDVVSRYCGSQAIQVPVAECPACGAAFRVLPSLVTPYKQHAASTLGRALGMRTGGGWRVVAQSVGVAVSLLKRWQRWWLQVQDVMWSQIQAKLRKNMSLEQWRRESSLVERVVEFPRWSGPAQCRA